MKRGGKLHYVKKSKEGKTAENSKMAVLEPSLMESDVKSLLEELADPSKFVEGTTRNEKNNAELATAIHGVIVKTHKAKKPLADIVSRIIGTHKGIVVLKELTEGQLNDLIGIIIDLVKKRKVKEERIACFRLLSHLIYEHHKIQNSLEVIIDPIVEQCGKITDEPKVSRHAFNCLGNLLFQYFESLRPKFEALLSVITSAFHQASDSFKPEIPSQVKEIQTITRCLGYCLSYPKTLSSDTLERIFMKLYKLLFLGTPYANFKVFSAKSGTQPASVGATSSSSSSEFSDAEDSASTTENLDKYGKLRTHTLLCIQQMCRLNDKFIFDKWHLLFPRYAFTTPVPIQKKGHKWEIDAEKLKKWSTSSEPNMLILMQLSKEPKVRIAVANTISAIIDHSPIKMWQGSLGTVGGFKKAFAFTSLSEVLGNVIISLHYILAYYLWNETDSIVQLQLLKCLSILLNITHYQKIPAGLITYILSETAWKILQGSPKNETITLNAINCFTSVANQRFAYPEFEQEFLRPTSTRNLIKLILTLGLNSEVGRSIECLVFFSKLCKNYSLSLQPYWPNLLPYIKQVFKDAYPLTTLGCVRIIEEYVKHYNALIYMNQPVTPNADVFDNKAFVELMQELIKVHLNEKASTESISEMQTAIINVLGIMSESQWTKLDMDVVASSVGFVMGVAGSGMSQSVALKAVGSMITYPSFNKNFEFVERAVSKIINNRNDTTMMVAIKNSWALANLCYCLEGLSKLGKFSELADCALLYAKSPKEKICSNGIRALGYILKKGENKEHFLIGKETLDSILNVIVSRLSAKSPKISWNACVAIGNILSNPHLPKGCLLYSPTTFNSLLTVILNKPNIKTKIHAIQALQNYKNKEEFGISFEKLVKALVTLYSEIGKMQFEDVTEYKYRDKLEAIIIDSLCYMTNLWGDTEKEADSISEAILNNYAGELLDVAINHLKKILKLEMMEKVTEADAKALAKEHEVILAKIKALMGKTTDWIKKSSKAHVSFGVVEQMRELATSPLEAFPFLSVFVPVKSKPKFIQSFQ